ncbi:MAG TPA: hypothetical protein VK988_12110, partial [Acidimicrobiales bacterium]|nr:hypothetical protein [Acidimicrobiales bacterium]
MYVLDVLGEAAGWSRISPRLLDLPGGAEASATVELRVPRASRPLAGTGHVTVRATSVTPPTAEASATGVLQVAPFAELRASLVPTASAGATSEHVLVLENLGNQPVQASVSAIPSDHRDVIRTDASVLRAAPGAQARTTIRVCPRRRWRWRAPRRGFTVLVDAGHAETVELQGVITEPSGLPAWAVRLVAVVAVALLSAVWRDQVDGWFQSERRSSRYSTTLDRRPSVLTVHACSWPSRRPILRRESLPTGSRVSSTTGTIVARSTWTWPPSEPPA